jgi:hypothetical protein
MTESNEYKAFAEATSIPPESRTPLQSECVAEASAKEPSWMRTPLDRAVGLIRGEDPKAAVLSRHLRRQGDTFNECVRRRNSIAPPPY